MARDDWNASDFYVTLMIMMMIGIMMMAGSMNLRTMNTWPIRISAILILVAMNWRYYRFIPSWWMVKIVATARQWGGYTVNNAQN